MRKTSSAPLLIAWALAAFAASAANAAGEAITCIVSGSTERPLSGTTTAATGLAPAEIHELKIASFENKSIPVGLGGEFPGAKGLMSYTNDVARLDFDFTNGGHYVTMGVGRIAAGGKLLHGSFRCGCEADVKVYLRARDAKGDTYVAGRTALNPGGEWREVSFNLAQLRWFFGSSTNAADRAKVKWPVYAEILVEPAERKLSGWVEARGVCLATEAYAAAQPDWTFQLRAPTGMASLFFPGETLSIPYAIRSLRLDGRNPAARLVRAVVTDADDAVVCERPLEATSGALSLDADALGGRFGAFKATLYGADAPAAEERAFGSAWFARLAGRSTPVAWCGTCFHVWWSGLHRFEMAAAAGIGTMRTDITWSSAWEKERGVYSCPKSFRVMLDEMHRLGIQLNGILNGSSHPLYGEPLTEDMDCVWATPARVKAGVRTLDEDAFCNWVRHFVTHEGSDVDFYEIWNEAWNFYFGRFYSWSKTTGIHHGDKVWARKFAAFSRKVADTIREVRPDANVGVCSEDGQDTSLIWMLEFGIARKEDCVTFHPYTHKVDPRPERNPFFFADEGRRMKAAQTANGGSSRLRITEYGFPTVRNDADGKHEYWFVGDYPAVTYHAQARYLIRAYLLAHSFGVESMMQYDFQDDGSNRNFTEHNFGMTFQNLAPKPSYAAVAFMTLTLGNAAPLGDFGTDPKTHRILGFERSDGRRVYVAWAVENPVNATLPKGLEGKTVALHDMWGTPVRADLGNGLALSEDPVYIVEK